LERDNLYGIVIEKSLAPNLEQSTSNSLRGDLKDYLCVVLVMSFLMSHIICLNNTHK